MMVCVKVTIAPRNAACFNVPREPTRYAATMVLPCPGVSACAAPKPNAIPMAAAIIHGRQRLLVKQPREWLGLRCGRLQ